MNGSYKEAGELPTAESWTNLERKRRAIKAEIRKVKAQITMTEKVGHYTRSVVKPTLEKILKKHTQKLHYVMKQMAKPCRFVDHVITNISNTIYNKMTNHFVGKHILYSKYLHSNGGWYRLQQHPRIPAQFAHQRSIQGCLQQITEDCNIIFAWGIGILKTVTIPRCKQHHNDQVNCTCIKSLMRANKLSVRECIWLWGWTAYT